MDRIGNKSVYLSFLLLMMPLNLVMERQFLCRMQFYGGDGVLRVLSTDAHLCDQNYDFHALAHDAVHFPLC